MLRIRMTKDVILSGFNPKDLRFFASHFVLRIRMTKGFFGRSSLRMTKRGFVVDFRMTKDVILSGFNPKDLRFFAFGIRMTKGFFGRSSLRMTRSGCSFGMTGVFNNLKTGTITGVDAFAKKWQRSNPAFS